MRRILAMKSFKKIDTDIYVFKSNEDRIKLNLTSDEIIKRFGVVELYGGGVRRDGVFVKIRLSDQNLKIYAERYAYLLNIIKKRWPNYSTHNNHHIERCEFSYLISEDKFNGKNMYVEITLKLEMTNYGKDGT